MAPWAVWIIGVAAVVTAIGVLWRLAIKPTALVITTASKAYPLMLEYVDAIHGTKNVAAVLAEIAAQFRNDSGSTLRDVVDELKSLAIHNAEAIGKAEHAVERAAAHAQANTILAERQAESTALLKLLVDRLGIKADAGAASNQRIEAHAAGVAADLLDSHARAAEVTGEPGAAADAASQSAPAS